MFDVPQRAKRRPAVSVTKAFPAPTKGWLASDKMITEKPYMYARVLDNFYVDEDGLELRQGGTQHAVLNSGAAIVALMTYTSGSNRKIFATTADSVFNVTAGGTITTADITTTAGGDWSWLNFATAGGQFLYIAKGAGDMIRYHDGTSWVTPAVTGADGTKLSYVFSYRQRLFFIQENTSDVWFLPVDSVAGAFQKLAIGGFLKKGGKLVAGGSITIDGGEGPDDYLFLISDEGEHYLAYGNNPADVRDWFFVGVFEGSRPIGRKCIRNVGGDVAVLTADGLMSLSKSLKLDKTALDKAMFTQNVEDAFRQAYDQGATRPYWQVSRYPKRNVAIVNVPLLDQSRVQFVFNVLTGAWSRFTGINATCWGEWASDATSDAIYYGTADGKIIEFDTVSNDNGVSYAGTVAHHFWNMGDAARQKHVKLVQPYLLCSHNLRHKFNISVDYKTRTPAEHDGYFDAQDGAVWDSSLFDQSYWAYSDQYQMKYRTLSGLGVFLSPAVWVSTEGLHATHRASAYYSGMNVVYETGNVIG